MSRLLLTGYPGFLGSRLLPRILGRTEGVSATCLVQPTVAELARRRLADLEMAEPSLRGRVQLLEGDISRADLGLGAGLRRIASEVTGLYHLAAVYDLGVRREVGMRVNLYGTRHVLDFAEACPGLERFHYVSTCYVSGRHPGIFGEEDLEKGQAFNNYYEETKYLAEVEVRDRTHRGLPATIYRPAIVVGDSETGATQKYDGPYSVIRWLLRQPGTAVLPMLGGADEARLNLVPSDFVVAAIDYLAALPHSTGRTYQLADPDPCTVSETVDLIAAATGRRLIRLPVAKSVATRALRSVPGLSRLTGIPAEALDYFDHPTHYSVQNAATDLHGSGISVPRLSDYVETLVKFVRAHPEVGSGAMA
jgi:thioester reductase-like protein